ncbi:MAG: hypothetical protein IIZ92_04415 [Aquincola sp.]|nr:hypothetical protein [Aquincola sp.]
MRASNAASWRTHELLRAINADGSPSIEIMLLKLDGEYSQPVLSTWSTCSKRRSPRFQNFLHEPGYLTVIHHMWCDKAN